VTARRAVTWVADDETAALDLNDIARDDGFLFVREGVGLAGRGVAARFPIAEACAGLAAIEHDDRSGTGVAPVGIGWVPFDPAGGSSRRSTGRASSWRPRAHRAPRPPPTRSNP